MGTAESSPEVQGWRILEVLPNGPCCDKGLCVYFDFIVGINGVRLTTNSEEFWDTITAKKDEEIILTCFNYKTRVKRDILMTPNNQWGGDGLLGLVVVRDDFTKCDQQAVRVLKVSADSPAQKAGLQPMNDYILGTPIAAFTEFGIFRDTVADYLDQALPIYVYNAEHATVRMVEIIPSSKWPGEGVLGCITGDGYLHQIPSLMENQETITFVPNSCYVISSRSPRQMSREMTDEITGSSEVIGSPSSGKEQKEEEPVPQNDAVEVSVDQKEAQNVVDDGMKEKNQISPHHHIDANNDGDAVSNEVETVEVESDLPTMVRWTDSSNKLTVTDDVLAGHETTDQQAMTHESGTVITSAPNHEADLLNQLETETQHVLAQQ